MAACHGRVSEFDGNADEWTVYADRLKHYFATNDVESADKQRAILLSGCGASTYKLMKSLVAPNALETKSFKELVDLVQLHLHPKPSAIVSRFRFNSGVRQHGESLAAYVASSRSAASTAHHWRRCYRIAWCAAFRTNAYSAASLLSQT